MSDTSRARLTGFNLGGANLVDTDLRRLDLSGADLREADMRFAYLAGNKVTHEQLAQAKSLEGATLPNGTMHE